jgi:hypothetical protein
MRVLPPIAIEDRALVGCRLELVRSRLTWMGAILCVRSDRAASRPRTAWLADPIQFRSSRLEGTPGPARYSWAPQARPRSLCGHLPPGGLQGGCPRLGTERMHQAHDLAAERTPADALECVSPRPKCDCTPQDCADACHAFNQGYGLSETACARVPERTGPRRPPQ